MNVITGKARGKRLIAPEGEHTRPTTGRVKESVFNIIQFDIEGRAVLDAFCGSGQMGIEALSRGASSCVFCDSDKKAAEVTKKNLENTKLEGGSVMCRDVGSVIKSAKQNSFGLVFLDAPYNTPLLSDTLSLIFEFDILQNGGIIVCESDIRENVSAEAPYRIVREYKYAKTKITTITKD